jgi:hypothetical protein
MITQFPNTISSGKILLPLSFLFLFLPNWSSVTVYGYTFPHLEEGQEKDCTPDEERYIIDDDDMQDSPTDSPELWMPERNEEDTKFVRVLTDAPPTKKDP